MNKCSLGAYDASASTPSRAARTIAAPFSAIMMVGAFVLVDVTAGMTEASIPRNPSRPCTLNVPSTTDIGSGPIRHEQLA